MEGLYSEVENVFEELSREGWCDIKMQLIKRNLLRTGKFFEPFDSLTLKNIWLTKYVKEIAQFTIQQRRQLKRHTNEHITAAPFHSTVKLGIESIYSRIQKDKGRDPTKEELINGFKQFRVDWNIINDHDVPPKVIINEFRALLKERRENIVNQKLSADWKLRLAEPVKSVSTNLEKYLKVYYKKKQKGLKWRDIIEEIGTKEQKKIAIRMREQKGYNKPKAEFDSIKRMYQEYNKKAKNITAVQID